MNSGNTSGETTPIITTGHSSFRPISSIDSISSIASIESSEYGSVVPSPEVNNITPLPSASEPIKTSIKPDSVVLSSEINNTPITPPPLSTQSSEFTWAFFNCPATLNIASLLLLAGGLFTLTAGVIAASAPIATTGAVIAGIGALLGLYGQFNKSGSAKVPEKDSNLSLRLS